MSTEAAAANRQLIMNTVGASSREDRRRLLILQIGFVGGFLPYLAFFIFYDIRNLTGLIIGLLFLALLLLFPLVVLLALDVLARWIIRLDTRELPRLVGWMLTALRVGTIFCLWLVHPDALHRV